MGASNRVYTALSRVAREIFPGGPRPLGKSAKAERVVEFGDDYATRTGHPAHLRERPTDLRDVASTLNAHVTSNVSLGTGSR